MIIERFSPPGFLTDLNEQQKRAWSLWLSDQFDAARAGRPNEFDFDGPREQFFNPLKVVTSAAEKPLDISWTGFPRNVQVSSISDRQRWQRADATRDVQDEYCEWSVTRDPTTNKIIRVTFTCEGPEYWQFLASAAPDTALKLYREFISPSVKEDDIFDASGIYNPRNRWNSSTTGGAMHLIQINNSLSAEIELAAGSSVVRKISGRLLTEARELIDCGKYGGAERHSDPHIGEQVNSLTRQRADVTLQDPVGLYFNDLLTTSWKTPDGSDPKSFWKYLRGDNGKYVRAVYEVPAAKGYVVGDIKINERNIEFGAQIADFVSIKLTGIATRFNQRDVEPMTGCRRRTTGGSGFESAALISVDAMVARSRAATRSTPSHISPPAALSHEPRVLEANQRLIDFAVDRWEALAIRQRQPAELAMRSIEYEIAEGWADAVLEGRDLEGVLRQQGITNPRAIVVIGDERKSSGDRSAIAESFFLILDGGIDNLPTAECIRSKLPPGRKPTEDELRRAFRECVGQP